MVAPTLPEAWVVGFSGVGRTFVADQILQTSYPSPSSDSIWNVDTKYYKANVRVCQIHLDNPPQDRTPEAVVLVVDATDPRVNADRLTDWWARSNASEEAVRLLVANHVQQPPSDAKEAREHAVRLADLEAWCHAELVEYVELSHISSQPDECEAMGRVVEALQAHRWPGMALKPHVPRGPVVENDPDGEPPAEGASTRQATEMQAALLANLIAQDPTLDELISEAETQEPDNTDDQLFVAMQRTCTFGWMDECVCDAGALCSVFFLFDAKYRHAK
ncbi:hypothetical protein H632_c129p1 [Helicosporidium sp. ATCC 50920]|nr:hypothetical protein H632_c129p1 [Helicosporidium sp. ATCC 50920]|eukprot:KDD76715.1 hypothetical protein H632_c129p1 [Helicosporidium sp. ATCC 50920]